MLVLEVSGLLLMLVFRVRGCPSREQDWYSQQWKKLVVSLVMLLRVLVVVSRSLQKYVLDLMVHFE